MVSNKVGYCLKSGIKSCVMNISIVIKFVLLEDGFRLRQQTCLTDFHLRYYKYGTKPIGQINLNNLES
jgi:hypothetical protein